MSAIGMMDGAFFVGRKEIVDWINSTLDLNISKVEETASGAIACQLLDIMYPNQVAMHKLNWAAKQDFEFVNNYKVLQTAFSKLGIEKHVDVDRLVKGQYMDNLEFMQWFKRFFEMTVHEKGDYDAYGQRCKGKGGAQYNNGGKKPKATAAVVKPKSAPAPKSSNENATPSNMNSHHGATRAVAKEAPAKVAAPAPVAPAAPQPVAEAPAAASNFTNNLLATELENANKEISNLRNALEESRKSYSDLKVDYDGLEKERDFYFEKLREIEVLLQEIEDKGESSELTTNIFKILYATADGFENNVVNDEQLLPAESADIINDLPAVVDNHSAVSQITQQLLPESITTSEETY